MKQFRMIKHGLIILTVSASIALLMKRGLLGVYLLPVPILMSLTGIVLVLIGEKRLRRQL